MKNTNELPAGYKLIAVGKTGVVDFGTLCGRAIVDRDWQQFKNNSGNVFIASVADLPENAFAPFFILCKDGSDAPFYGR